MANPDHLALLRKHIEEGTIEEWNQWRRETDGLSVHEVIGYGKQQFRNIDLRGADLGSADLRGSDLSNADLRGVSLINTQFRGADLAGANLSGATGFFSDFSFANLARAVWVNSDIDEVSLVGADLSFANLRGWNAGGSFAGGASFANANLDDSYFAVSAPNADFTDASLRRVRFEYSSLDSPTTLSGANLSGADLTGASFDSDFLDLGIKVSLSETDFSKAVLRDVVGLGTTLGSALYDSETDFTNAWADLDATIPFDPVAAGWTLVPEPGTKCDPATCLTASLEILAPFPISA